MAEKKPRAAKTARPAADPENREQQLIGLAVDLAEKQLRDGSASPSVINHFLKLATTREVIEREILERQAKLLEAKTNNIVHEKEQEGMAKAALEALKKYTPGS